MTEYWPRFPKLSELAKADEEAFEEVVHQAQLDAISHEDDGGFPMPFQVTFAKTEVIPLRLRFYWRPKRP